MAELGYKLKIFPYHLICYLYYTQVTDDTNELR